MILEGKNIKNLFLHFFLVTLSSSLYAQTGNNWAFGYHGGLNFDTEPPSVILTKIQNNKYYTSWKEEPAHGASSISDCSGELLFYMSGCHIYNRKHEVMPNGDMDSCKVNNNHQYNTLIFPAPGDSNKYYAIHSYSHFTNVYYTIVDMSLDSGYGDVISKERIIHNYSATDQFNVTPHYNGKDLWFVLMDYIDSISRTAFYAFKVDKNGFNKPVMSYFFKKYHDRGSQLKFAHNGNEIFAGSLFSKPILNRFTFNNANGKVYKPEAILDIDSFQTTDIEISPDNSKIYAFVNTSGFTKGKLYQIENIAKNPDKTAVIIGKYPVTHALQLAPNNKIYTAPFGVSYLGVIDQPNRKGKACNFIDSAIDISPAVAGNRLPSIYDPLRNVEFKVKTHCAETIEFVNVSDTVGKDSTELVKFIWYFGDGATDTSYHAQHAYDTPGTYFVKMAGLNICGYKTWYSDSVEVYIPVKAGFEVDTQYYTCQQAHIQLKDTSQHSTYYAWDFGDSSAVDSNQHPKHDYDSSGTYTIRQIASNDHCVDTAYLTDSFYIEEPPQAGFTTGKQADCTPFTVSLKDNSVYDSLHKGAVEWTVTSDHNSSINFLSPQSNFSPQLTDSGFYSVQLVAFNNQGCSDTLIHDSVFYASPRPQPEFTYVVDTQCLQMDFQFDGKHLNGNQFNWQTEHISLGKTQSSALEDPVFTFADSGEYKVSFTATNDYCSDTYIDTITADIEPYPVAGYKTTSSDAVKLNPVAACPPLNVNFTNESKNAFSYEWLVQQDTFKTTNANYTFTDTGLHSVTLIAHNHQYCSDTLIKQPVYISPVPVSYFGKEDTQGCQYVSFRFFDSSQHTNQWQWNFGDGTADTIMNPAHTYTDSGAFDVTLISSNDFCSDTFRFLNYINIIPAPKPGFSLVYDEACTPLTINIDSVTSKYVKAFHYDFGNGMMDTVPKPEVTYHDEDEYTIKQEIVGTTGCVVHDSLTIKVFEQPNAFFAIEDSFVFCHEKAYLFKNTSTPINPKLEEGLLYKWFFETKSGIATDTIPNPQRHYLSSGDYDVQLITTNGVCKDSLLKILKVKLRQKPVADFVADSLEQCLPGVVDFQNLSSEADSFIWDFGNGSFSNLENPKTIFSDTGKFDISLIVISKEGCSDTLIKPSYVQVIDPVKASFLVNDTLGCAPLHINFTNTSEPEKQEQTYTWHTGDGNTFHSKDLDYIFHNKANKDYIVKLIADNGFCMDSTEQIVRVRGFGSGSESITLNYVTVKDNESILVDWEAHPFAKEYLLERSIDSANWSQVSVNGTQFDDRQTDVHRQSYYYRIKGIDDCGNQSLAENIGKSILLKGKNEDNVKAKLNWNVYVQWPEGVKTYQLQKMDAQGNFVPITNQPEKTKFTDQTFFDVERDSQVYRVIAYEKNGAFQSLSNEVVIPVNSLVYIPNAFSPNGDGINDSFYVQTNSVKEFSLKIYNRWGQEVFRTEDAEEAWDGTMGDGRTVQHGTYIYLLKMKGTHGEDFYRNGTVELIR